MRNQKGQSDPVAGFIAVMFFVVVIIGVIGFGMWLFPTYGVWAAEQEGKAELAKADYSKQVAVQTAKAKNDAAKFEADAEVTRAYGVAKANNIIGESLKNNEAYLRYLWIHTMEDTKNQVIYVPTEAGLPVLEAGKREKAD